MKIADIWGSCCDLGFGSHIGGTIFIAAVWYKSDRLSVFTSDARVAIDYSNDWGLQRCEV